MLYYLLEGNKGHFGLIGVLQCLNVLLCYDGTVCWFSFSLLLWQKPDWREVGHLKNIVITATAHCHNWLQLFSSCHRKDIVKNMYIICKMRNEISAHEQITLVITVTTVVQLQLLLHNAANLIKCCFMSLLQATTVCVCVCICATFSSAHMPRYPLGV